MWRATRAFRRETFGRRWSLEQQSIVWRRCLSYRSIRDPSVTGYLPAYSSRDPISCLPIGDSSHISLFQPRLPPSPSPSSTSPTTTRPWLPPDPLDCHLPALFSNSESLPIRPFQPRVSCVRTSYLTVHRDTTDAGPLPVLIFRTRHSYSYASQPASGPCHPLFCRRTLLHGHIRRSVEVRRTARGYHVGTQAFVVTCHGQTATGWQTAADCDCSHLN